MKVEIIEDHNNTEVKKSSGGFGINATMAADDSDCYWKTTVDGNLISQRHNKNMRSRKKIYIPCNRSILPELQRNRGIKHN